MHIKAVMNKFTGASSKWHFGNSFLNFLFIFDFLVKSQQFEDMREISPMFNLSNFFIIWRYKSKIIIRSIAQIILKSNMIPFFLSYHLQTCGAAVCNLVIRLFPVIENRVGPVIHHVIEHEARATSMDPFFIWIVMLSKTGKQMLSFDKSNWDIIILFRFFTYFKK